MAHHPFEMPKGGGGDKGAGDSGAGGHDGGALSSAVQNMFSSIMKGEPPNFAEMGKQIADGIAKTGDLYK